MSLDLSKPLQLRDGTPCRLICSDLKGDRPLLASYIDPSDGEECTIRRPATGQWLTDEESCQDLINVPEAPKRFRREHWVNVWENFEPCFYATEAAAQADVSRIVPRPIACIRVTIEGEYGEGLNREGDKP